MRALSQVHFARDPEAHALNIRVPAAANWMKNSVQKWRSRRENTYFMQAVQTLPVILDRCRQCNWIFRGLDRDKLSNLFESSGADLSKRIRGAMRLGSAFRERIILDLAHLASRLASTRANSSRWLQKILKKWKLTKFRNACGASSFSCRNLCSNHANYSLYERRGWIYVCNRCRRGELFR